MELKVNKRIEVIEVKDDGGAVALRWEVPTDDASMQRMTNLLANAISRAAQLSSDIENADGEEAEQLSTEELVKLQKRVITAVLGDGAYDELLEYMGDGEPIDPAKNICSIGEVFAALCVWVNERCTNAQLRAAAEKLCVSPEPRGRKGRKRK